MRIVHVVESFSPLSETFIYDYVTELQEQGLKNYVLTGRRENELQRPYDNVTLWELPSRWSLERMWSRLAATVGAVEPDLQYWALIRRRIARFLEELAPDVVHAHFGPIGVLIQPLTSSMGIPLVVSYHGFDVFKLGEAPVWRKRYKALFKGTHAITVVSQAMKNHLITNLNAPLRKVHVVHVGKKLAEYSYRPPTRPVKKWLSIGRLCEKKGFFDCIEAFAAASREYEMYLSIVGTGPLESDLKSFAREIGVADRVRFLGPVSHDNVIQLLSESDAFVLCSKSSRDGDREGIPTVLMEAQAIGLPVVSTAQSGIPEVIPAKNHWLLAPEGNVEEIARRMRTVVDCEDHVLTESSGLGRRIVEEEFDLRVIGNQLQDLYVKCVGDIRG